MLKTITKVYEAKVCDYCGREDPEDLPFLKVCPVCGKDVCPYCNVHVEFYIKDPKSGEGNIKQITMCCEHLPEGLVK